MTTTKMTGQGPSLAPNLDICTAAQLAVLGTVINGPAGRQFRYVQFVDAVTYVAGHIVTRASATDWVVTNDRAGGSNVAGHEVIGMVFQDTVPTQNQFGWVQCKGISLVAPTGTYAAGDYCIPHATTDGAAVISGYAAAKADFNIFGKALSSSRINLGWCA